MKGRISIKDFIHRVKSELVEAQDQTGDPFYELTEVTLEVAFALEAVGKAGFDLYVIEFGGEAKAQQSHKVVLKLTPLQRQVAGPPSPDVVEEKTQRALETAGVEAKAREPEPPKPKSMGGRVPGGSPFGRGGPVYDKIR